MYFDELYNNIELHYFDDYGANSKIRHRGYNYFNQSINTATNLFSWGRLNDFINTDILEMILITQGSAVVGKLSNGDIACGSAKFGNLDHNGEPINLSGTTIDGKEITDCVYIRNNANACGEMSFINKFIGHNAMCDFSQEKLLQKSVCNPIPFASNEQTYRGIKEALKKSLNSDIFVLKLPERNILDSDIDYKDFDVLDLTNIAYADKFKYLTSYQEYVEKRFYHHFGFGLHAPTKQAQTTTIELDGRTATSEIYVSKMLECRKRAEKKLSVLLGVDVVVDYTPVLKNALTVDNNDLQDVESEVKNETD